ncbi:hypothetical protein POM88_006374 [Heracleum sosnowskyi]|uniref:START domain-containing protein n=1 Tax=Heracleum sosnowskyi TaxID=360622 RepID=A0AAD8N5C4_9APIA|nr:hypothetical protein POM88_006374 [Heracleum sosnowskyi]
MFCDTTTDHRVSWCAPECPLSPIGVVLHIAGSIGVLQGAERFDHTRGCKFSTYIQYWIRKSILMLVERNCRGVKIRGMYEQAIQVVNDAVGSIRTVASFSAEEKLMDVYHKKCEFPVKSGIKLGIVSGVSLGMASSAIFGIVMVTWLEHMEVEDRPVHLIINQFVSSGVAFGAERWLAVLQRQCERLEMQLIWVLMP